MREFVGPYRILETLGRGGMGIVYRGVHDNLGRQVAIKALAPELTQQPQFRERFFSEARTQAQLQHPNIVTIYDLIEDEGDFFIVMEFVEGRELDGLLHERQGRGLEISEAVQIFGQILAALDGAHSQGVIHRDVKSSNVLVDGRGQVKLMDFGIALLIGDKRLTQSSQTIGTPVYMSPEQILRPREVDHRTDIYSAGVLFYEMLSGQPPFDADTEYEIKKQHIEGTPSDVSTIVEDIPKELSEVIAKALAKDPEDRFASAGEFLRALCLATPEDIDAAVPRGAIPRATVPIEMEPGQTAPAAPPPPLPAPVAVPTLNRPSSGSTAPAGRRRRWLSILSAAAVALSLLIAGGLLFLDSNSVPTPVIEPPAETPKPNSRPPLETVDPLAAAQKAQNIIRTPPPPPPPPPPPQSPPPPPRISEAEIQRRTVETIRKELHAGIKQAEAQLERGRFEEAQEKVQQLSARASRYQSELLDEVVELRLLDEKIGTAKFETEVRRKESEVQHAAWQKRIGEIQSLIDSKKFPEAKNLARALIAQNDVPDEISLQAENLAKAADQGLKEVLENMKIEIEEVEVEGETKRAKRRRKKEGGGGS